MVLQAPWVRVEDTDIRGYPDGRVKYNFNQGTAYHMRVGRRYNGSSQNEYELKRSLVRWVVPHLPPGARISAVRARFWLEAPEAKSPLPDHLRRPGLHLFAYPVPPIWNEGNGGVSRDSFSDAALGEVSWNDARTGEERWPIPGGLEADASPVGTALLDHEEGWIDVAGGGLASYVAERIARGQSVDLMLKLDDVEEDLWGTEIALLTSDFGDDYDRPSKRPALILDLEIEGRELSRSVDFVLETGGRLDAEPNRHPGATVLLRAEPAEEVSGEFPPAVWVRGGAGSPDPTATWEPLRLPVSREWDWSQFRVSAVERRLSWGEPFTWSILATWVQPGPRDSQRPELVLLAPSGEARRLEAAATEGLGYRLEFVPDEPGLWRYIWSYRPMHVSAPMAHTSRGAFWVSLLPEGAGLGEIEALAELIVARFESREAQSPGDALLFNSFVKESGRLIRSNPEWADRITESISRVRRAAPEARLEAGIRSRFE
jgi:hypothetical protein